MAAPLSVLITGSTRGIGRALALAYAAPGVELILHGRNTAGLEEVAAQCRARGASVRCLSIDIRDTDALRTRMAALIDERPVDLLIANAAVGLHLAEDGSGEPWTAIEELMQTNVLGAIASVHAVLPSMRARRSGQIALMSSLAAWHGVPMMPSYSASKAALKAYGEGLRGWLAPEGIGVTVVMPGFVESRMSDETPGPKPFLITADRAAAIIKSRLRRNPARISFPFPLNASNWCLGALPSDVSRRVLVASGYGP